MSCHLHALVHNFYQKTTSWQLGAGWPGRKILMHCFLLRCTRTRTYIYTMDRMDKWNKRLCDFGVGVELRKGRGRCVVAKRKLRKGDVVLTEKPFAFALHFAARTTRCSTCFLARTDLLCCSRCHVTRYCSSQCQRKDWKNGFHKVECSILAKLEAIFDENTVTNCLLAGRTLQQKRTSCKFDGVKGMCTDTPSSFTVRQRHKEAKSMMRYAPKLFDDCTLEDVVGILSRFQCNNFAITTPTLQSVGAGVYPAGALLNHSCEPNCVVTYQPLTLQQEFRAIRNIEIGEELTHAFVDVADTTERRRMKLESDYGFVCDCSMCSERKKSMHIMASLQKKVDPTWSNRTTGFTRDQCVGGSSPLEAGTTCTVELDLAERFARAALETDDAVKEMQLLRRCWSLRIKHLHPLSSVLLKTSNALFAIALALGHLEDATTYCEMSALICEHLYGGVHPVVGIKLYTLGNLQLETSSVPARVAVENLAKARAVLLVTHGARSVLCEGLDGLLATAKRRAVAE